MVQVLFTSAIFQKIGPVSLDPSDQTTAVFILLTFAYCILQLNIEEISRD